MVGNNPFAKRVAKQQELDLAGEAVQEAIVDQLLPARRPTMFESLVTKMFGGHGGVALATVVTPKPMSKRRARRLRGKAKEQRA